MLHRDTEDVQKRVDILHSSKFDRLNPKQKEAIVRNPVAGQVHADFFNSKSKFNVLFCFQLHFASVLQLLVNVPGMCLHLLQVLDFYAKTYCAFLLLFSTLTTIFIPALYIRHVQSVN